MATAVSREHTGLSYELTAPSLRRGFSCRQWRTGNIPVTPMQGIDWNVGVPYRLVERSDRAVSLLLRIHSRIPSIGTHPFRINTVRLRGRWYVSYFLATDIPGPPPLSGR